MKPCAHIHNVSEMHALGLRDAFYTQRNKEIWARFTKYLTLYHYLKLIVRSTYDSDLKCSTITIRIPQANSRTLSQTILQFFD